tara:strand:+ start:833 stop:1081 length:249 start_codon:yes stop_codon:yes gene_type:complete
MDVSTATIKFSKQEIEQLIKSIVLRLNISQDNFFGKDEERPSYQRLKKDLIKIKKQLVEGEQESNGHVTKQDFYGNVCENCE